MSELDWKNKPLMDWARSNHHSWFNNLILSWRDVLPEESEFQQYVYRVEDTASDLDVSNIVGQWEHYQGQSWREALLDPQYKRWKMLLNVAMADRNPAYYFSDDCDRQEISFSSIDGTNWYTHGGGAHRTVIAKFLFQMRKNYTGAPMLIRGVSKRRYFVDNVSWDYARQLALLSSERNLPLFVKAHREADGSRKKNSWNLFFSVSDNRYGHRRSVMPPDQFHRFAERVLQSNGKLRFREKAGYISSMFLPFVNRSDIRWER